MGEERHKASLRFAKDDSFGVPLCVVRAVKWPWMGSNSENQLVNENQTYRRAILDANYIKLDDYFKTGITMSFNSSPLINRVTETYRHDFMDRRNQFSYSVDFNSYNIHAYAH